MLTSDYIMRYSILISQGIGLGVTPYSSRLNLDLKADAIGRPINVAQRFRDFFLQSGMGAIVRLVQR